jgi:formylglycine-generating enzyme required for sulfatase activity
MPDGFLHSVGLALLDTMDDSVLSDVSIEASPELANSIWTSWDSQADHSRKYAELQGLVQLDDDGLDDAIERVEAKLGTTPKSDVGKALASYLRLLPGTIRQFCKRPDQPAGTALPQGLPLYGSWDVLPLLPPRLPWFQPGDRPWGIGDWELCDLIELRDGGEVWKAANPRKKGTLPVALHFFTTSASKKHLKNAGPTLDRLMTISAQLPHVVPLQEVHLHADPPCVQYAYLEAGNLASLVQQWRETQARPDVWQVTELVRQIARNLGDLHALKPAIVHRLLRPTNVLLATHPTQGWQCHLANLGLGDWSASANRSAPPPVNHYASPEQCNEDPPHPRDDVFALGVLWYQLVLGNLDKPRPGGGAWRRHLAQRGLPSPLIELLEQCFDDEPDQRPADGHDLAKRIADLVKAAKSSSPVATLSTPAKPIEAPVPPSTAKAKILADAIGMKLAAVPAGKFLMGSPETEAGRRSVETSPRHVVIAKPYLLGVFPVTQKQYQKVMGVNPSHFHAANGGGPDYPVENVSWHDAVAFCERLTRAMADKLAGRRYRLPTEAEWEHACRAGTTTAFTFGDTLPAGWANCDTGLSNDVPTATTPLGRHPANAFGICDLHGNVWEWCSDTIDPDARFRVLRGGSWRNHARSCRSASRHGLDPATRARDIGFRVVLEV